MDERADDFVARRRLQEVLQEMLLNAWKKWADKAPSRPTTVSTAAVGRAVFAARTARGDNVNEESCQHSVRDLLRPTRLGNPSGFAVRQLLDCFDVTDDERTTVTDALRDAIDEASGGAGRGKFERTLLSGSGQITVFDLLHITFYTDPGLVRARKLLEHCYEERVDPFVQRYLMSNLQPSLRVLPEELRHDESDVICYLNCMEHLCLTVITGQTTDQQLRAGFRYWIELLFAEPRYAALRPYLALEDFELLADRIGMSQTRAQRIQRTVGVYGSLRRGQPGHPLMGEGVRSTYRGTASAPGRIYEVNPGEADPTVDFSYPCFVPGAVGDTSQGTVVLELYEVSDPLLWAELDLNESIPGYGPEYMRRIIHVIGAEDDDLDAAWVYHYIHAEPDPSRIIPSGDWSNR